MEWHQAEISTAVSALEAQLDSQQRTIKELIDSPTYTKAVKEIRDQVTSHWENAKVVESREAAWHLLKAISLLDTVLQGYVNNEAIEKALTEKKEKKTFFFG